MTTPIRDFFVKDSPYPDRANRGSPENLIADPIEGCSAVPIQDNRDDRGVLLELLTTRDAPIEPIVHVYQVWAEPGSIRGWVYHARQIDRLAFTTGSFRVVLFDLRETSPTYRKLNEFNVGAERKVLLTVPAFVAHCVANLGNEGANFVNLPTRPFYRDDPDKYRLPLDSELIGYRFKT